MDGFTGTAAVDQAVTPPVDEDSTLVIDTLAGLPNALTIIPIGVRFTVVGSTGGPYSVTATQANEQQLVDLGTTTSGDYTLTFTDPDGVEDTTANIDTEATAAAVQAALLLLDNIDSGDVAVTGDAGGPYTVEFKGQFLATDVATLVLIDVSLVAPDTTISVIHAGATTWMLTFTPELDEATHGLPANDAVITLLPQILDIKIGDGNVTYTESSEYEYDLDRGLLDSVRAGNQVPMDVSFDFVYEFITTYTGEDIAPMDALKGIGGAALWVSSATDLCEPYAIDVVVIHTPLCTTSAIETLTFPDFRSESREPDMGEASIAVSGRCNVIQPIVERTPQ